MRQRHKHDPASPHWAYPNVPGHQKHTLVPTTSDALTGRCILTRMRTHSHPRMRTPPSLPLASKPLHDRHSDAGLGVAHLTRLLVALGVVAHVLALQEHVDFAEGGAVGLLGVPTLAHQVVDLLGRALGLREVDLTRRVRVEEVRAVLYHLKREEEAEVSCGCM